MRRTCIGCLRSSKEKNGAEGEWVVGNEIRAIIEEQIIVVLIYIICHYYIYRHTFCCCSVAKLCLTLL